MLTTFSESKVWDPIWDSEQKMGRCPVGIKTNLEHDSLSSDTLEDDGLDNKQIGEGNLIWFCHL